jgi:Na+/melibiose symporter-like transporter
MPTCSGMPVDAQRHRYGRKRRVVDSSVAESMPQARSAPMPASRDQTGVARHISLAAYGAPGFATQFLISPSWSIIPAVYATYHGVSLAVIAMIVLATRVIDAIIDPVIGVLSDRHRARGGSRRSWVMIGGLGLVVAGYFLYAPPMAVSATYLFLAMVAFFIFWTTIEVPQFAWGREIGSTIQERSVAFGWKTVFGFAGHATFFSIPFLWFLPTREYSPQLMEIAALVGMSTMVVALCANYLLAPEGTPAKHEPLNMRALRNFARKSPPMRLLFLIIAVDTIGGGGMWYGAMYIYLNAKIGDADTIALIFLGAAFIGLCAIPLWTKAVQSTGPVWGLVICKSIFALTLLATLVLSSATSSWIPLTLIAIGFFTVAGANVVYPLLLADVADHGLLKTKVDFGGTMFAGHAFIQKICYAIGVSAALAIIEIFGFNAALKEQSDLAHIGLLLSFVGIPLILMIVVVALASRIALTPRRTALVRKRLQHTGRLA